MDLFRQEPQVLNVGLASFSDAIARAGGAATQGVEGVDAA